MTTTNGLIDELIRIKDWGVKMQSDVHAINEACALLTSREAMRTLGWDLLKLLDAALPLLDAQAEKERKAEAGKPMRQITHQSRAKAAHEAVAKAQEVFGYLP